MREGERRRALKSAYQQTEVPLIEVRAAGHRFVFDQLEERLAAARERVTELVNPLR